MKIFLSIVAVFFFSTAFCQHYLENNEKLIFSFDTQNEKKLVLAKDSNNLYIVYRFGTKDKIEFEFPENNKDSWSKFKYSFYMRGGGVQNEGMDLDYVYFSNNGFQYIIYNTYYASENKVTIGVKIVDSKTNKTTNIKGILKSRKGALADFRNNNLLKITDELPE
ncbi:MAG: hypothetical protein QM764_00020 [Chitinophagaceae bacterium]